ncbi:MAG TPA: DUF2975 domain-containing protein [Chitinophaga sp.]|uniref:DUF2975 domain-containing protein n=1 Tax=Chitinophaga sp. TaxID=1869181 RepID=UPI002DB79DB7|nr:DUF2975 domain-containing protein [Chitinophaga sp.]HEU4555218.1 DUF2975 domain-containing protein [Chitinophaga sp.]
MLGQRTFMITRRFVDIMFYLILIISVAVVGIRTYRLVKGSSKLENPSHQPPLSFDVMHFGSGTQNESPYTFSEGKLAALQRPPNHYLLLVGYRSPLGIYNYFLTLLFTAGILYGMAQLRRIFHSISVREPFADSNPARIRNIGLVLIASDVAKGINYIIFNSLANRYFSGIELLTQIGFGIWAGLLMLAIAVVYRRGVELYSENQLTI